MLTSPTALSAYVASSSFDHSLPDQVYVDLYETLERSKSSIRRITKLDSTIKECIFLQSGGTASHIMLKLWPNLQWEGKSTFRIRRAVQDALDTNSLDKILDVSAGDWHVQAEKLIKLGLKCCAMNGRNRPDAEEA
ncbi:hypothetical protein Cni_G16700 [Canna indica]|uniref:RING-type E3 ubiquitin transferase n=1 Tax=Canna indica TaxID=4628 RepID=A0AAQ3QH18_9LILI|nr:hypothetical protein Cni_G16700 [Canna indica]